MRSIVILRERKRMKLGRTFEMEASITVWPPVAVHHTTRDAMIGVCVLTPFSVQS